MFTIDNSCVYGCPKNTFEDPINFSCVQSCDENSYPNGKACKECAYECNGCVGSQNSQCKKCREGFPYRVGICTGKCPEFGYTIIQA